MRNELNCYKIVWFTPEDGKRVEFTHSVSARDALEMFHFNFPLRYAENISAVGTLGDEN